MKKILFTLCFLLMFLALCAAAHAATDPYVQFDTIVEVHAYVNNGLQEFTMGPNLDPSNFQSLTELDIAINTVQENSARVQSLAYVQEGLKTIRQNLIDSGDILALDNTRRVTIWQMADEIAVNDNAIANYSQIFGDIAGALAQMLVVVDQLTILAQEMDQDAQWFYHERIDSEVKRSMVFSALGAASYPDVCFGAYAFVNDQDGEVQGWIVESINFAYFRQNWRSHAVMAELELQLLTNQFGNIQYSFPQWLLDAILPGNPMQSIFDNYDYSVSLQQDAVGYAEGIVNACPF